MYLDFVVLFSPLGRLLKCLSMSSLKQHLLWGDSPVLPRYSLPLQPLCPREPYACLHCVILLVMAYSRGARVQLLVGRSAPPPTGLLLFEEVWHEFQSSRHLTKPLSQNSCPIKADRYFHMQRGKRTAEKCLHRHILHSPDGSLMNYKALSLCL